MPNLGLFIRASTRAHGVSAGHRCANCGQDLQLARRHTSPARLGAPVTTEFHQCPACDSGYAFNPATGRWKTWAAADD